MDFIYTPRGVTEKVVKEEIRSWYTNSSTAIIKKMQEENYIRHCEPVHLLEKQ